MLMLYPIALYSINVETELTDELQIQANHLRISALQKNGEDLEVRNPMFFEDVPTWNGSAVTDDEESPNSVTVEGTTMSPEETDAEGTAEQRPSPSLTPSAPSPQPPPSTPTSSTPTPSPSEEAGTDAKTTDLNKNLTQVLREAVKPRNTSDDP